MRTPWGDKRWRSTKKRLKLAAKERRALQEADEDAGRRSPPIPNDPPRVKMERDYFTALRSPLSRLDGSPPRAVDKATALLLSHKKARRSGHR